MKKTGKEKELKQEEEQEQVLEEIQETVPENSETAELENQLEKKDEELKELKDQFQRLAAEFDNYKKKNRKGKGKALCIVGSRCCSGIHTRCGQYRSGAEGL